MNHTLVEKVKALSKLGLSLEEIEELLLADASKDKGLGIVEKSNSFLLDALAAAMRRCGLIDDEDDGKETSKDKGRALSTDPQIRMNQLTKNALGGQQWKR